MPELEKESNRMLDVQWFSVLMCFVTSLLQAILRLQGNNLGPILLHIGALPLTATDFIITLFLILTI